MAAFAANGHATLDSGEADCTITAEIDPDSTNTTEARDAGIVARWSDADNYWRIGINSAADAVRITERNATTNTVRASGSVTIDADTLYTLQAVLSGDDINVTVDGGSGISYGSATLNQTATIHGIYAREAAARADDFLIETAAGAYTLEADAGAYTISGQAAGLLASRLLAADAGSYAVTGQAASLLISRLLQADAGAYVLTGQDVTLTYTPAGEYTIALDAGSYAISGQTVDLLVDRLLSPDAGAYTVSGQDAALLFGRLLQAEAGAYAISGQDAGLLIARLLAANAGSYALSGQAVTLVYSGAEAAVTPDSRIFVVPFEDRTFIVVWENRTFLVQ